MRLGRSFLCVIAAPLLLLASGCGDDGAGAAAAPAATAPPAAALGNATIRGVVTFHGEPPAAEQVVAKDCHAGGGMIEVAPVRVDDAGRLRDVVVFLKNAPAAAGSAAAAEPVVLDQVNCEYVPHVVAVRVGQTLRVKSSDPTLHNVHGLPSDNAAFNFGMVGAGQTKDLSFAVAESFKVKCDVHPWMSAAVNVFDHPFFIVAGPDGAYELKNLPAGEHTLVFRHDWLGDVEVRVKAEDAKTVVADAAFGRRAP